MSKVKFFSNNLVILGGKESEIVSSLRGSRVVWQQIFTVPKHTVGTKNLLIFLDGKIMIQGRDYEDINSYEVQLTYPIDPGKDFHAILVKTGKDGNGALEWESF
ncbi:MAG: hypothetical protein MJA82_12955 [Clostridia bacterium]|nr:hypothetical protein [Clostridia bacterium]